MPYDGTSGDDVIDAIKLGLIDVHVRGGAGNDTIMPAGYADCEGQAGNDTIIGTNQPNVSASYASAPSGIIANIVTGIVQDGYGTQDTLVDIVNITGSRFSDQFFGSQASETFDGGGGSDTFVGGGGIDTVKYRNVKSTEAQLVYDSLTGITTVKKTVPNGDQGTDALRGINSMSFADGVTITTVADTPYYSLKVNTLPDFAQYYKWSGWTTGGNVFSVATAIADINGDGKADIVLAFSETQFNFGIVTNASTPNRVVILESQSDGTYTDATSALFGTNDPLVLPGQARDVSVGDVNGDGKPDFGYSLSREDGRSSDILSNMVAQSVVLVSQLDGTYKVVNVGAPDWSQSIKITNYGGVGHVYFQGYTNANLSFIYGNPTAGQIISGIDCVLNPAGTAFIINGLPPVSGTGLVVLPPSTKSGAASQIITEAGDANGGFAALAVLGNDGNWTIASTLQPFQMSKVPYVAWNGSTAVQASVATVNGEALLGFSCDFFALLNSYYPGSPPVAVLNYNGETLPAPDSAGFYHQGGGRVYDHLVFCSAIDNKLVPAPIKIVNEDTSHVFNFVDFLDLTHNGLLDIISYPYRVGGQPCVYLNTGAGIFVKVDSAIFPQAPADWGKAATAKFLDSNGDSIYDLMYWPSNGVKPASNPQPSTADNTPQLYIGGQSTLLMGSTYADAIVISDRITSPLINTFAGNDIICDLGANPSPTSIDGGLGVDTSWYSYLRGKYQITHNGDGTWGVTQSGAIADTLKNIERLKFSDGYVALDVGANQSAGATQLLLGAVLGKDLLATKQPLIGAVIDLFDHAYTLQQLSGAVMRLPIWDALTGKAVPTNTDIANYLLWRLNGVTPDVSTLANAVNALDAQPDINHGQGDFLWHLAESAANQAQVGLVGLAATGLAFTV